MNIFGNRANLLDIYILSVVIKKVDAMNWKTKLKDLLFGFRKAQKVLPVNVDKDQDQKNEEMGKSYSADAPLVDPKEDKFDRLHFAKRIARTIASRRDRRNLVIAIYGRWGEGKTTLLNFIEQYLIEYPEIIVFKFNPWRFPSEAELLTNFFYTLANELGKSLPTEKEKFGEWIDEYLTPLAALLDRAEAAKTLGQLLSKVKIEELSDRIGSILKKEGKLIVVLMDDIDRLEKSEIHSVFRLVKLSANLDNLIYILAFDDEVVADALQERYGTANAEAGRNFLEKIVQVPLEMPSINEQSLRSFCFSGIDNALNDSGIQLSEEEIQQFVTGFGRYIEIRLKTPRMAIRYANMLLFSLPMVKGEVNIVDFLLIEALRAFFPSAYDVVRDNQEIFVGTKIAGFDSAKNVREVYKNQIEIAFTNLKKTEADSAKGLLTLLFPRLQTIYGNTSFLSEWDKTWAEEKRVASARYFKRYFSYSVPTNDISDREIESIISNLEVLDINEISSKISDLLTLNNAESFVYKLRIQASNLSEEVSKRLVIILSMLGERFPNPQQMLSFDTPFTRAAMLISHLIENVSSIDERLGIAEQVVINSEPLPFAAEIIRWLRTDKSRYPNAVSKENKDMLENLLAERVETVA